MFVFIGGDQRDRRNCQQDLRVRVHSAQQRQKIDHIADCFVLAEVPEFVVRVVSMLADNARRHGIDRAVMGVRPRFSQSQRKDKQVQIPEH